jgi:hypothetical protein
VTRRRKSSIEAQAARFTPGVCQLWRDLQDALRDGDPVRAGNVESRLRMELGVTADRSLPVQALHRAAHPGQKLPPLYELPVVGSDHPTALPDLTPLLAPQREIPSVPLKTRAELIEMHIALQNDLARFGMVKATEEAQHRLDRELCRVHGLSPFGEDLERALDQLHLEAYAGVKPHPPRLMARDGPVELEDILRD